MAEQLGFDLPARAALGRDDFFVSDANAMALALVDSWPNWAGNKLAIIGPEGSGKTHLTHVWAAQSGARIVDAASLTKDAVPDLAQTPIAVENVPAIAKDAAAQDALFHLHNLTLAEGHSLLVTGVSEPKHWGLTLPDLRSRLEGTTTAVLKEPDDALLSILLAKLFVDRQLTPNTETIAYMVKHMDRSFAEARRLVRDIDQASLAKKRKVSRALAAEVMNS
ncbi:chromosomal replication initiator DnaA [Cognatishimia activa]|uniref:Chromosomal replication initiator DnaA n=1 Tax=Cognatishimia activa TaxID=1715691 RepID=A0A975EP50_9RHOB|nr:chromosomal replication initiator DnaA [Cognatishimia activa]QTN35302.1 chromosomal replication initiator DnaA [Cognatishimia activa]